MSGPVITIPQVIQQQQINLSNEKIPRELLTELFGSIEAALLAVYAPESLVTKDISKADFQEVLRELTDKNSVLYQSAA